jgi:hypothetical protein
VTEEWRDIPDYEGYYQASTLGRIQSVDRHVNHGGRWGDITRLMTGRIIKPWPHSKGDRLIVALSKDGVVKKKGVHRLIALAFHGQPAEPELMALHDNGNAFDNRPENIYWGTQSQNNLDAVRHGTQWPSVKVECPHGHLLEHPNLRIAYLAKYNRRACRSCSNACEWARRRRGNVTVAEKREYADMRYVEIMGMRVLCA